MTDTSTPSQAAPVMREYQPGDEDGIVRLLNKSFGGAWGTIATWQSKHLKAVTSGAERILVFEVDSRIVACGHYVLLPFVGEPGLVLDCRVGSDVAVDPEYRRHGLMMIARRAELGWIKSDRTPLRLGFTTPEMHDKVYRGNFGHTYLHATARHCTRILSTESLRTHLESVATRMSSSRRFQRFLRSEPISVRLDIAGFQPLTLRLSSSATQCIVGASGDENCSMELPFNLLTAAREGSLPLLLRLFQSVLLGRVRIRGWRSLLAWLWKGLAAPAGRS